MTKHVTISVDGEHVALPGGTHDVAYVLTASGLGFAPRHDLLRVDVDVDGKHVVTYSPGDTIVLEDGDGTCPGSRWTHSAPWSVARVAPSTRRRSISSRLRRTGRSSQRSRPR